MRDDDGGPIMTSARWCQCQIGDVWGRCVCTGGWTDQPAGRKACCSVGRERRGEGGGRERGMVRRNGVSCSRIAQLALRLFFWGGWGGGTAGWTFTDLSAGGGYGPCYMLCCIIILSTHLLSYPVPYLRNDSGMKKMLSIHHSRLKEPSRRYGHSCDSRVLPDPIVHKYI